MGERERERNNFVCVRKLCIERERERERERELQIYCKRIDIRRAKNKMKINGRGMVTLR